jgi:DNA-binding NarL/FixJ family response regulator
MIRRGLAQLLEQANYEIVCEAESWSEAESRLISTQPEVVILGSHIVGSEFNMRSLHTELQNVTFVILATVACDDDILRQADGVVNLYDNATKLTKKLQAAIEQSQTNTYSDSHDLSERERDVLVLIAKGLANKEIADELNISIHTVMSHRKNIAHKTGIKSVAGLTVYALLNNMLDASEVNM